MLTSVKILRRPLLPLLTCLFLLIAGPVLALDLEPFRVHNLSPAALVHPLAIAESARLVDPGVYKIFFSFDLANHASLSKNSNEQIRLDGETLVSTLGLRYGLGEQLQIGVDLPWVNHGKGSLDNFISNWHDFFGLSNGDRDRLPENDLAFVYQRNGEELLDLDRPTNGIGDLRLLLAWQLTSGESTATALQASLKAPTGDAAKLTGSDGWEAALALALDHRIPLQHGRLALWGGLGGSWLGNGEVLDGQAEDWAANAWLGAGWSPLQWLAFKLQLDARTALYDSALAELGDPAVILTMGGSLGLGERTTLDLGVGEDLVVNASPDVTFHLGLTHRF